MCFFISAESAKLEQTEPISTLKTIIFRKCSFKTVTQFSLGNNVLSAPASYTDGFLLIDACVPSNYLSRPIWGTLNLSCRRYSL
jgi:hypothetical protein